jgi:peptidoglycan/LPS O-acetylase OafA/YrhL
VWQEISLVTHTGVIGMALLPFAAILSYHYIEQPGIRLGRSIISAERPTQKFAAVPSRGGGDCRRGPSTL